MKPYPEAHQVGLHARGTQGIHSRAAAVREFEAWYDYRSNHLAPGYTKEQFKKEFMRGWGDKSRNPTIYQALAQKLGRQPTNAQLKAEVERIKKEAYIEAASKGKLAHQRNPLRSARQFGLAEAVASGRARKTSMPKSVARELIAKTPARERSKFARQLAAERTNPVLNLTQAQKYEIINNYHLARTATGSNSRYDRMLWVAKQFAKDYPEYADKQKSLWLTIEHLLGNNPSNRPNPGKYAAAYLKAYKHAYAVDDEFQKALEKEYGRSAGDGRYKVRHQSAVVSALAGKKVKADAAMKKALDEMRAHGESVNPTAFDKCVASVKKSGSAYSPRGVCAAAGRRKYGAKAFAAMAARGRRAKGNAQHLASLTQGKVRGEVFSAGQGAYRAVVKFGKQAEEQTLNSFKSAMSWLRLRMHELSANPIAAATLYTLDQMGGKKSLAAKLEKLAHKRWNGGKRNPEDTAAKLFEVFHGFESKEVLEYVQEEHVHEWLAGIGPLVSLVVQNEAKTKQMTLYAPDPANTDFEQWVQVGVTEDGKQLEFVGGDQSIDLDRMMKEFGLTEDDIRDRMFIGDVVQITYRTRKSFELQGKEEVDFFHDHGKEGAKGVLPKLVYKPLNPSIEFVGGRYKIAAPERELDGVSPGIVG